MQDRNKVGKKLAPSTTRPLPEGLKVLVPALEAVVALVA
jgi:hypothetical protein